MASAPVPVIAGTATGTVAVSLTVESACHLEARPLSFGSARGDGVQLNAESQLSVACSPEAAYVIGMDEGRQGANGRRRMASSQSGAFVEYDIYRDAARTQRWGAGAADAASGVIPASGTIVLPVYGRAIASDAAAGRYDDTITVTVSF